MSALPHLRGYQLLEDLGPSRLGRAYRALHLVLDRTVLIKLLDSGTITPPVVRDRFLRGAAAAVKVRHKNIVALYGVETCPDSGQEFVVLEHVEGSSLEDILAAQGRLPEAKALAIGLGVVQALTCLEGHDLVHRYLTPHTILISEEGRPKLSDLGLAKPLGSRLSGSQRFPGSAHYMSPEQALGLHVDSRSDLYSLGLILFEMLTGRLPQRSAPADPRKHQAVSRASAELVLQLCAPSPADRPPSAAAAEMAFKQLSAGATVLVPPAPDAAKFLMDDGSASPRAPLKIRIEVDGQPVVEREFKLDRIQVGRDADCALKLETPVVSRHHAELTWEGDILWIVPQSGTNPTTVNGHKLESPLPLHPGDTIVLSNEVRLILDWPIPDQRRASTRTWHREPAAPAAPKASQESSPPKSPSPEPERPRHPQLVCAEDARVYSLSPMVQAGSSASCDLRLAAEAPRKALVVFAGPVGSWLINVSPDPTAIQVNQEPISDASRLRDGDRISFYGRELTFRER
jgi:serine/threonine protein kinase